MLHDTVQRKKARENKEARAKERERDTAQRKKAREDEEARAFFVRHYLRAEVNTASVASVAGSAESSHPARSSPTILERERRLQPDLPPALTPAAEHAELGHPSISVRPPGPSTARSESPGYPSL